jgi:hypothetical protein
LHGREAVERNLDPQEVGAPHQRQHKDEGEASSAGGHSTGVS